MMMRKPGLPCVLFLLLCCAPDRALVAAQGLPDAVVPAPFGVNIHFVVPNEQEADAIAAGGFSIVRMDFNWGAIERRKGDYDFSGYDKLVEGLSRRGVRLLFILDYSNPLYDGGLSPHTQEGRVAFAKYAAAAAAHYAGKGILWEIWNEPNISFWKPAPNVEDYAKLALVTIEEVRKADPQAFIMGPASSEFPWEFFTVLGERGVLAKLDAVSVHPYRGNNPETAESDFARLRALVDRYSRGRVVPLVSGEWGYSMANAPITEERQAQYLARQWLSNMACDVRLSIWYDWRNDGGDPKDIEHNFGTVFRDQKPKASYVAAQTLCNGLRGYRFVRRISMERAGDYGILLRKGDDCVMAVWTTLVAHEIELPMPADGERLEMLGARSQLKSEKGRATLTLSHSPQYVFCPQSAAALGAFWRPAAVMQSIAAGKEATLAVDVENTAARTMSGTLNLREGERVLGSVAVSVAAGEKKTCAIAFTYRNRDREQSLVQLEWTDATGSSLNRTPVTLLVSNAITLSVLPWSDTAVPVQIDNPSGEALELKLRLIGTGKITPVTLANGQTRLITLIPIDKPIPPGNGTCVECLGERDFVVAHGRVVTWRNMTWKYPNWKIGFSGDNKVAGTAKVSIAEAPGPLPDQAACPVLQVDYRFGQGWKFIELSPPEFERGIHENPVELGFWVFGDGSGNILRCRFGDANGQTFQPGGTRINWKGWKFVRISFMDPKPEHWGGRNDGVPQQPLRWFCPVLIDSVKQVVDTDCRVLFTDFSLGY